MAHKWPGHLSGQAPNPQIAAITTVFRAREENRTPDLRITSQSIQTVRTGMAWYLAVLKASESADTTSYRAIRRSLWLSCRSRGSFGGGSAGEVGPVAAK